MYGSKSHFHFAENLFSSKLTFSESVSCTQFVENIDKLDMCFQALGSEFVEKPLFQAGGSRGIAPWLGDGKHSS